MGNHPNEWVCWVPWAEYYYNTTYCTNLPTSILDGYWRRHPHHLSCTTSRTRLAALEDTLQQQDQILTNVHSRFHQAQARMKRQYNEAHREVSFEPSEWVLFKLHRHKQHSLASHRHHKLVQQFYSPSSSATWELAEF